MHNAMNAVLEFHEAVNQPIGDPRAPDTTVDQQLRWDLIHEEMQELTMALDGVDRDGNALSPQDQIVATADALGDLAYVICGAAVSWGIDLGAVFDAVHESNMSKIEGGVKKRADGKVLKGPKYHPPDIAGALALAKAEAEEHGFGEDCFWPTPTVLKNLPPKKCLRLKCSGLPACEAVCDGFHATDCEVSQEEHAKTSNLKIDLEEPPPVSKELKLAAAMKSIKEDFVPDLKGYFTSYGCYVFDCTKCKRTHTADMKNGTRNGWASKTVTECMCGMRFEIVFVQNKGKDPSVQARATDLGGTAPSGGA